jgi:hypothetical protein
MLVSACLANYRYLKEGRGDKIVPGQLDFKFPWITLFSGFINGILGDNANGDL